MSVMLYDLYVPGKYINKDMIVKNSYVINWAAAWLDTDYNIKGRVFSEVVTPSEARRHHDRRILAHLFDLMDEADYWAGHNFNAFDAKKLKWRFLIHRFGFPLESKRLDSYIMAGRHTKPPSRGLEPLSLALGGTRKKGLDVHEWKEIVQLGTPRLLRKADIYCRGDVRNGVGVLREYAKAIEQSGQRIVLK